MPRIARPTGQQIRRFGNLKREGPGDPLMKRTLPGSRGSGSSDSSFDLGLWQGGVLQSGQENTQTSYGGGHAVSASSAASGVLSDATGIYNLYRTGTAVSDFAGWFTTSNLDWTSLNGLPIATWVVKTGPAASDIANCRIWLILTSDNFNAGTLDADTAVSNAIAFRYSTVAGDTSWQSVTTDAVPNNTVMDTGVVVAVDTRYVLRAKVASLTSVEFSITSASQLTAGDLKTTHTTTLPVASTGLTAMVGIINTAMGTARNIYWRLFALRSL